MEANISLSPKYFTQFENFGHSLRAPSYRFRPTSVKEIEEVFCLARESHLTVTARGAGRSYNDAALNGGGIILDMSAMNRILAWDPATGLVRCEPGVTLEQLWQRVEPDDVVHGRHRYLGHLGGLGQRCREQLRRQEDHARRW